MGKDRIHKLKKCFEDIAKKKRVDADVLMAVWDILISSSSIRTLNDGTEVFGTSLSLNVIGEHVGYGDLYVRSCIRELLNLGLIVEIQKGALQDARKKFYHMNKNW